MRKITLLAILLCSAIASAQQSGSSDRYPISPNPSNGRIQLTLPADHQEVSLSVYNVLGVMLLKKQIEAPDGIVMIDISSEPAGVYMVNIRDNRGTTTKKIILK